MVSVDWAVWVFHSKGLAIYAAASTLGEAQGRCEGLQAALGEWQAKAGGLEEALEAQCTAQESLEYQLTTVQDRHAEASEKIKAMQKNGKHSKGGKRVGTPGVPAPPPKAAELPDHPHKGRNVQVSMNNYLGIPRFPKYS